MIRMRVTKGRWSTVMFSFLISTTNFCLDVSSPLPEPAQPSNVDQKTNEGLQQEASQGNISQGIDTIDVEEGGNWLIKRKALEDTVDRIEQINNLFTQILETRMDFQIKRNKIDTEYDVFAATVGFDLGDADQLLSNLVERMEAERRQQGDLTEEEREVLEAINEKKGEIKQLQAELKTMDELENKINDVVITVEKQIDTANAYRSQAWRNFQEIKKVFSDEKAEELYFKTDALLKNMQEILIYLTGQLPQYFNDQLQTMRDQMNSVKNIIQSLQAKGLDLKQEVQRQEENEFASERRKQKQKEQESHEKAVKESKGLWSTIKTIISYPFVLVKNLFDWFIGLFSKKSATEPLARSMPQEEQGKPVPGTMPLAKPEEHHL